MGYYVKNLIELISRDPDTGEIWLTYGGGHIYTVRLNDDLWLDPNLDWYPGTWPASGYNHVANGPQPHGDERWVEAAYLHPIKGLVKRNVNNLRIRRTVSRFSRSIEHSNGCSLSTGMVAATAPNRPMRFTLGWQTRLKGLFLIRYQRNVKCQV